MSDTEVELLVGSRFGDYDIERELGRGGMGIVYKAHERSLQRVVALKIMAPGMVRDRGTVKRFLREARAGGRLNHPNIVPIYAVGSVEGRYFISMAYVSGESLFEIIRRKGKLPLSRALDITRQVADALMDAHAHKIVHRDIKPENIMIDKAGRVHVMDFGLVHIMSREGRLRGGG